MKLGKLKRG